MELHRKKINSVHLEPSGKPLLVTASTDTTVAVWDIRKTIDKKPLDSLPHGKSCHGAYWNPSGDGSLATVSFDDYVRLFDRSLSGKHVLSHRVRHNNNTVGRYGTTCIAGVLTCLAVLMMWHVPPLHCMAVP